MTNETKVYRGTPKTLEASGGTITNNSVVQADDASYSPSADGGDYPDAEFYLSAAFTTAPTEGTSLLLYARPLDIDSTNDAEAPEAARPTCFIGSFVVNNVGSSTMQYMQLQGNYARDVPAKADYYIHNNGTGQSVNSGWKLVVVPRTKGPA